MDELAFSAHKGAAVGDRVTAVSHEEPMVRGKEIVHYAKEIRNCLKDFCCATDVARSSHICGTIVSQPWHNIFRRDKEINL